jgi:hypothetical protein
MASPTIDWNMYDRDVRRELGDTYAGRPLLLRDVPILGGVAYWGNSIEATIIDPDVCPDQYDRLYTLAKDMATSHGIVRSEPLQRAIGAAVRTVMPYASTLQLETAIRTIATADGWDDDEPLEGFPVDLGELMEVGIGRCVQHAAGAGYLVDRFCSEGYMPLGDLSIDVNIVGWPDPNAKAHTWLRHNPYETATPVIYDPAQHAQGCVADATRQSGWPYARPEEMALLAS